MTPVYHKECNSLVCYFKERVKDGETVYTDNVVFPDGRQFEPGNVLFCQKCFMYMTASRIYQGEPWKDWFLILPSFKSPRSSAE